jgi:hypothetical protein
MQTMWNRVVLLTCGMAFGWGLANYWSAPWAEIGKHRYRLIASAAIGLLLTAGLAWQQLGSGLVALGMLAGSAAISYAANAKQLGKPVAPLYERPEMPPGQETAPGVVLVANAEPEGYAGPSPWAERLRQERPGPHWLLRPYLCQRIRSAYRRMPAGAPSWRALGDLEVQVQERLGTRAVVRAALLWGEPSPPDVLRNLAQQGRRRLVILPVDLEPAHIVDLRQGVVETRLREAGVAVEVLPGCTVGVWQRAQSEANLALLRRGESPVEAPPLEPATVEGVSAHIMEQL